jgi:transcriptional regulator GlxA family with amidase domain
MSLIFGKMFPPLGTYNGRKGQSFSWKGQTTMPATNEIGIVVYPGVQAAPVHGLTDLFGIAAFIALDQQRHDPVTLRVTHWRPAHSRDAKLSCVYDSDPRGSPQPRTLIIPPTMVDLPNPSVPAGVVAWLRSRHAGGAKLVAVCSGAFLLAETGLVAGRWVSTHRICAEALAKRFPEIHVDTRRRIIDHGDIITAGGFMAWVDIGLLLVDRILGSVVKAETARFILSEPAASEARYFAGFAPRQAHGDTAVLKAQDWVHIRDGRDVSACFHGSGGGTGKAHVPPPVRECNGHDTDRILSSYSYCASARAPGVREHASKGDRPIPPV